MVAVPLVVSVVSIAFLIGVAAAVRYFAFAGPSRDLTGSLDESEASAAD